MAASAEEKLLKSIERMIKDYPYLQRVVRDNRAGTTVAVSTSRYEIGADIHGKGVHSDPTANAVLNAHEPTNINRKVKAVRQAIARTRKMPDGSARLRIVTLTHWTLPCLTQSEAAEVEHCSCVKVSSYLKEFYEQVKISLKLDTCDGCIYWRPLLNSVYACHYCYDQLSPRQYVEKDGLQFDCLAKIEGDYENTLISMRRKECRKTGYEEWKERHDAG